MQRIENHCVDCGLPCLGSSCPNRNVRVDYCDNCETNYAKYHVDGNDLCETCTEKYLQETFDDLTVSEKAEALDVSVTSL